MVDDIAGDEEGGEACCVEYIRGGEDGHFGSTFQSKYKVGIYLK